MVKLGVILLVKLNDAYWHQRMTTNAFVLSVKKLVKSTPGEINHTLTHSLWHILTRKCSHTLPLPISLSHFHTPLSLSPSCPLSHTRTHMLTGKGSNPDCKHFIMMCPNAVFLPLSLILSTPIPTNRNICIFPQPNIQQWKAQKKTSFGHVIKP